MDAIILAAGKGTRLLPLTQNLPKHLLAVAGKSILKRIVDELLLFKEINRIVIVVHYFEDLIKNEINTWYSKEILDRIIFITQKSPKGTGDALKTVFAHMQIEDTFILIYGDLVFGKGLYNMIHAYKNNSNQGYILGVNVDNPTDFGVLQCEGSNLISILEKPTSASKDALINAGIYIFPKESADYIGQLETSKRGEIELTDLISILIENNHKLEIVKLSSGWFDVGFPWQLLNVNEYLMNIESESYKVKGMVEPHSTVSSNAYIASSARIRSGVYIEGNVFIDDGADVGPNCFIRGNTYIGKNVRVGNACEIKNSIIYDDTHIAHLSYVGDSIIGKHCNFGAGTITANLRHDNKSINVGVKNERINSERRKLGVIMGDNVKTGISVSILPGVIISSNSQINANELVSRDVQ